MVKSKSCFMAILIRLLFTHVPVSASSSDSVQLVVNGAPLSETAYNRNGTLYIPFRAVFEQAGIPFEYDLQSHIISYTFQDEPYSIDITQESIITPDGGYGLSMTKRTASF
ncbi:hypothetical protein ACFSL6_21160 [Paenibacillus thailandensis]|uniref:Copper amine oxidase-like N-terminal domain-containing protein n=1 Tax=Paenibacillus thailandensis TaxID=393250 RepID=A0ABW5QY36_9BACL